MNASPDRKHCRAVRRHAKTLVWSVAERNCTSVYTFSQQDFKGLHAYAFYDCPVGGGWRHARITELRRSSRVWIFKIAVVLRHSSGYDVRHRYRVLSTTLDWVSRNVEKRWLESRRRYKIRNNMILRLFIPFLFSEEAWDIFCWIFSVESKSCQGLNSDTIESWLSESIVTDVVRIYEIFG